MQTEVNINKNNLTKQLESLYEIKIQQLEFIPMGMSSSVYRVISDNKNFCLKIFLRIQKGTYKFERFMQESTGTSLLHDNGFKNLSFPLRTVSNKSWFEFEDKPCVLYEYIDGKQLNEIKFNEQIAKDMALVLANQHKIGTKLINAEIEKRDYFQDFRSDFEKIYDRIENKDFGDNGYKKIAKELYLKNKSKIYEELKYFEDMQDVLRNENKNLTITHGDLNFSNILIDKNQELFIIDWEDITIAERERDLYFFTLEQEPEFNFEEIFFRTYVENSEGINLNPTAFAYNTLIWDIGEREDWATRLFFEDYSLEQNKLDLEEAEIYVNKNINKDKYIKRLTELFIRLKNY